MQVGDIILSVASMNCKRYGSLGWHNNQERVWKKDSMSRIICKHKKRSARRSASLKNSMLALAQERFHLR